MERARLGYLVALLMTAGHPSRAIADTNASTGCDEGKWTYADDSHKQATARGKLKKVDLASDGDAHLNITPTEDSKALLKDKNNTVDQRDYLTTEVHLIANQGGDVSKFAGLVNSKFKVGMNAIADGDWVVDEHDYNIFRNVFAGDRDTRWTELHPLRTMRASNEPDPTATSNFVYLLAQDWHRCRAFKAANKTVSETLTVAIPSAVDEVDVMSTGTRSPNAGFVREQSVLDGVNGQFRSLYTTIHNGFPNAHELRVHVRLASPMPVWLVEYLPGYLAEFSSGQQAAFWDQIQMTKVTLPTGKKALKFTITARLTGSAGGRTPLEATWSLGDEGGAVSTTQIANPLNKEFKFDRWYSPSEGKVPTAWTLGLTARDRPTTEIPKPASDGWGWARTFINKERTYRLIPSYIIVEKTGANPGGLPHCDGTIRLDATEHLLPGITLTTPLRWRIVLLPFVTTKFGASSLPVPSRVVKRVEPAPQRVVPASGVAVALPYSLTVDPANAHRATVSLTSGSGSVTVEVSAVTELGEELVTQVDVSPICSGDLDVVQPKFDWIEIWKAGLAIQDLSHVGGTKLPTTIKASKLGNLERATDLDDWGTKLDPSLRDERDAFIAYVAGAPLTAGQMKALASLERRGKAIAIDKPIATLKPYLSKAIRELQVTPRTIVTNGRLVRAK